VIAAGFFKSRLVLDGFVLSASSGGQNIFIAKFAATDGHVLWARNFASNADNRAWSMAVDGAGDVFVTGAFYGAVDFGTGYVWSQSTSYQDAFLVKVSGADGHYLWARTMGGVGEDLGQGVAVDGAGNVAVTGKFQGQSDWGRGPMTTAGGYDIAVAKYAGATGVPMWSRRLGGVYDEEGLAVSADGAGNVVATGYFYGTVDAGTGPMTSRGGGDVFVVKYGAQNGTTTWSKRFGGTSQDVGYGTVMDDAGNALVVGEFWQTADFDGVPLVSAGSVDTFLVRIAP
jgi:hypothetical protein